MKEELIQRAYELAKERYAAIGVDVEKQWMLCKRFPSPCTVGRQMM